MVINKHLICYCSLLFAEKSSQINIFNFKILLWQTSKSLNSQKLALEISILFNLYYWKVLSVSNISLKSNVLFILYIIKYMNYLQN